VLKIAFDSVYVHPLPEGHRFPMLKYELIPEQLIYEGTCTKDNFFSPGLVDHQWVLGVHTTSYLDDLLQLRLSPKAQRKIGFSLNETLVKRELIITQGTITCCHYAFENGVAFNVAGGTHHAYADSGEGFCLLNDVAVASHFLLENKLAGKILVIDLDVHQGNGTAKIFENDSRVFTFSMHGKDNYPLHKEKSDLDIELPTHCEDEVYLSLLYDHLPQILSDQKPDFLFFVSGVDILKTDKLGKLSVSPEGCRKRDEFVFQMAKDFRLPIVTVMGGGYSPKIADIVEAHCNTYRVANDMYF
jgi:acetoin utilization deacetylase AcuC-like enzyme